VAETTSGIEMMRRRMERASRRPPAPRRPRAASPPEAGDEPPASEAATAGAVGGGDDEAPVDRPSRARRPAPPIRLGPDLPAVNLAIRVRRPLDDRLADLIHALRTDGVRTSKVELVEMLLWELPENDQPALVRRLARFREWAPRGASAPIGRAESA
jgi:hypothetical protein